MLSFDIVVQSYWNKADIFQLLPKYSYSDSDRIVPTELTEDAPAISSRWRWPLRRQVSQGGVDSTDNSPKLEENFRSDVSVEEEAHIPRAS